MAPERYTRPQRGAVGLARQSTAETQAVAPNQGASARSRQFSTGNRGGSIMRELFFAICISAAFIGIALLSS
jgi:hypothetical protein